MAPRAPTEHQSVAVDASLEELLNWGQFIPLETPLTSNSAITAHSQWKAPPNSQPILFYLWDFVNRSKYMLSEYETIRSGRSVENPRNPMGAIGISLNQLNSIGNVKVLRLSLTCIRKEERAAVKVILDVCSRIFKVNMMVNDTSGKTAMITRRPRIDFGKRIKDAVKVLQDSCSEEHVMAGTMG